MLSLNTAVIRQKQFFLRILLTTAYLLTIYSTLGIARPAAEFLRTKGLLIPTVILLFIGFTPLILFWRYTAIRQKQLFLRILLMTALLCIAVLIPALPEERLHFLTYGLAGWLICWSQEAMIGRSEAAERNRLKKLWLVPCLLVWLAGGVDELIQWVLPTRVFDIRDILFNSIAGTAGVTLFATGRREKKGQRDGENQAV
ncbi:MAG: hypothetical protein ACL93V_04510 [Candidatus Electrothrix sp. YB6]